MIRTYLEARTVATSALLTASTTLWRNTSGDSSSDLGLGISTEGFDNEGREDPRLEGGDVTCPSNTFGELDEVGV